jgi:hypothetical protein
MTVHERFLCPECGRDVAGLNPRGGDGSAIRLRPHNDQVGPDGLRCAVGARVFLSLEAAP